MSDANDTNVDTEVKNEGMAVSAEAKKAVISEEEQRKMIKELREESKERRLKLLEKDRALEEKQKILDERERELLEFSEKAKNFESQKEGLSAKYIRAEAKAALIREGVLDPEISKLLDYSKISLDESGSITGIDEIVAEFKKEKPHFFPDGKKTSSSKAAPNYSDTSEGRAPGVKHLSASDPLIDIEIKNFLKDKNW